MKCIVALGLVVGSCISATHVLAAGLDTGAYINQARGFTGQAMSMRDVMAPVMQMASNLPHMAAPQGNYSFVLQNGNFNTAAVSQNGAQNASFVMQTGYQNSAYLQQFGSGHQSFVIQNGMGNIASVTQR